MIAQKDRVRRPVGRGKSSALRTRSFWTSWQNGGVSRTDLSQRIVEPSNSVLLGELSKRDQFAEPFVTENCRPSELGPFGEVVQKGRVRAVSEIEAALEALRCKGFTAKNKTPEFAAAKLQKIGRASRADEILAKNKTPEFAAGEARKNGRPSSGRQDPREKQNSRVRPGGGRKDRGAVRGRRDSHEKQNSRVRPGRGRRESETKKRPARAGRPSSWI